IAATRVGCASIVVAPKAWSIVVGNAAGASSVADVVADAAGVVESVLHAARPASARTAAAAAPVRRRRGPEVEMLTWVCLSWGARRRAMMTRPRGRRVRQVRARARSALRAAAPPVAHEG